MEHYMNCLKNHCDDILQRAVEQNPLPEPEKGKRGKQRKGKIRALIDRLIAYKGKVCRFSDNALVPFTNNQSERDLCIIKIKNKVIVCFHSQKGAKDFLALKSLTSTIAKLGLTFFQTVQALLCGTLFAWELNSY